MSRLGIIQCVMSGCAGSVSRQRWGMTDEWCLHHELRLTGDTVSNCICHSTVHQAADHWKQRVEITSVSFIKIDWQET